MGKVIKDTPHANGIDICIYTQDFENEFISLTDIARYKSEDPAAVIQKRCYRISGIMGKTAKQWKDEHPSVKGNMRDVATLNQLLVLANLKSYNAILINQGKSQKERMELLRQLTVQQLQTLETVSLNNFPRLGTISQKD